MKCLNPLLGRRAGKHESGKDKYYMTNPWRYKQPQEVIDSLPVADALFACRRCAGCIEDRVTHWSLRCHHQEMMTPGGRFLTLTYDDEHLPGVSLDPRDFRLFVRALRRAFPDSDFRYLGCGEYGERGERPHFHILIWGLPPDLPLTFQAKSDKGFDMFVNEQLTDIWGKGFVNIQLFDASHGGYIAAYIQKSWSPSEVTKGPNGRRSDERFCVKAGDFVQLERPFIRPSKRPIGRDWYEAFACDLLKGYVTYQGRVVSIPETYMNWLQDDYPDQFEAIKRRGEEFIAKQGYFEGDNSLPRLEGRRTYKTEVAKRRGLKGYG